MSAVVLQRIRTIGHTLLGETVDDAGVVLFFDRHRGSLPGTISAVLVSGHGSGSWGQTGRVGHGDTVDEALADLTAVLGREAEEKRRRLEEAMR